MDMVVVGPLFNISDGWRQWPADNIALFRIMVQPTIAYLFEFLQVSYFVVMYG